MTLSVNGSNYRDLMCNLPYLFYNILTFMSFFFTWVRFFPSKVNVVNPSLATFKIKRTISLNRPNHRNPMYNLPYYYYSFLCLWVVGIGLIVCRCNWRSGTCFFNPFSPLVTRSKWLILIISSSRLKCFHDWVNC